MVSGFIQVSRELFEHPVWINSTPEQKVILLTILEKANYKPASWEWNGNVISVQRGQFITSVEKLVQSGGKGITTAKVRTALKRFEKFGILTSKTTNQSTLITVENYDFITCGTDENDKQLSKRLANEKQTDDKRIATTNKNNKENKDNKRERIDSPLYDFTLGIIGYFNTVAGTHFDGTDETYVELMAEHLDRGHTEEQLKRVIDRKVKEWTSPNNTNDMTGNIKPTTVLSLKRFDEYINSPSVAPDSKQSESDIESKIEEQCKIMDALITSFGERAYKLDDYMIAETRKEKYQKQLEKHHGEVATTASIC